MKAKRKSIFRLDEIRCEEAESPNYFEANISIRGHFSTLEIAVEAMKRNASETYLPEEIYAYLIKEIAVDGELGDVDWLNVRSFVLDAIDDSYRILPISNNPDDHLHVPPTHVFRLKHSLSEEVIAGLQKKLKKDCFL